MGEIIKAKLRQIGTSAGIIIPLDKLNEIGANMGDEIEIAILPKKKDLSGFGMTKDFKIPFKRDKRTRSFK
ncbi:MAG: hypothetical protein AABX19_01750 [Nanoarchaeota archaeon]